jgi:hypothetical protein
MPVDAVEMFNSSKILESGAVSSGNKVCKRSNEDMEGEAARHQSVTKKIRHIAHGKFVWRDTDLAVACFCLI